MLRFMDLLDTVEKAYPAPETTPTPEPTPAPPPVVEPKDPPVGGKEEED